MQSNLIETQKQRWSIRRSNLAADLCLRSADRVEVEAQVLRLSPAWLVCKIWKKPVPDRQA